MTSIDTILTDHFRVSEGLCNMGLKNAYGQARNLGGGRSYRPPSEDCIIVNNNIQIKNRIMNLHNNIRNSY